MSKTFELKLTHDPDELIAKARSEAKDHGVEFVGDGQTGRFSGRGIEGSYLIMEDTLCVKVARKPLIMPWALIEAALKKYFT